MKFSSRKTTTIAIALLLIFAMAFPLVALPAANAQSSGEMTSYAFISVAPNPVGVSQTTYISMWVDVPLPGAAFNNDIRRHGYKITITKPDGSVAATEEWAVVQDPTGVESISFTPDKVGTYALLFEYAGQVYTWDATEWDERSSWTGITFLPASATTTLIVQQEPLPNPITSYPLPTEYWTRPIEGQNTDWYTISSHWLGANYFGTFQVPSDRFDFWQRDGVAPNSPHIMWTKPIEFGGVVGGSKTDIVGDTYYSGGSYEGRFENTIIMQGMLFYSVPLNHAGSGGGYAAVDLRTGEEIWYRDDIRPQKGQLLTYESPNQHGVVGGILWETVGSTWNAYDAFTGKWIFNLTNVPAGRVEATSAGAEVYTDRGEIVRYVLNYENRWLALWNSTDAVGFVGREEWRPLGKSIDASTSTAYSWNVTVPDLPGNSAPTIVAILPDDIILGTSSVITNRGARMRDRSTPSPLTFWALSDKPTSRGQLLWIKDYALPAGNITRFLGPVDPVNRVWTLTDSETMDWLGLSLDDGSLLWGPAKAETRALNFFGSGSGAAQKAVTAYGNIYVQGFGGELFCYSTKNGTLLWKYNNTESGLEAPWGLLPIFVAAIADGKVYAFNNEHSPNSPLYKGYKIYCIDAFTGEEIWTMMGWAGQVGGGGISTSVLADGVLAYYNYYDNSIYAVGKGPSATTVMASPKVSVHGDSVLVEGMVTDIAAGTTQDEQAARFPNGVPAVSDESMGEWMEYVYMQKPRPTNVTGVEVVLEVLDPNNNYYEVGRATSDANGLFHCAFTPEVPGEYTIIATFEGSEGYWPSHAETAINVEDAPAATPAPTPTPASIADLYLVPGIIGIIVAIAVVGAILVLMLRKR